MLKQQAQLAPLCRHLLHAHLRHDELQKDEILLIREVESSSFGDLAQSK